MFSELWCQITLACVFVGSNEDFQILTLPAGVGLLLAHFSSRIGVSVLDNNSRDCLESKLKII